MGSAGSMSVSHLTMEQTIIVCSLLALAFASWLVSFLGLGPMMEMAFRLDAIAFILFVSTWTVGMVAMMFPTAVPMMLFFLHVGKTATPEIRAGGGPTMSKGALFIASYIAVWVAVGIAIYFALGVVSVLLNLEALMMEISSPIAAGLALFVVGVYQLSPIKGECLDRCHPTNFVFRYYRGGKIGALKMGGFYAKYCVGCCWVMMLFLLLVGAMGPLWMVLFAALIFMERSLVHGPWPSRIIGVGFLSAGIIRLLTS